jgi:hypothetical protein
VNILFKRQVPKDFAFKSDNEDAYRYSPSKRIAVLSDGASESFDAKLWAKLLVKYFIDNQCVNTAWFNSIKQSYRRKFDFNNLSWAKQAAYVRGSFASLLSVIEDPKGETVKVLAIGDSIAFLIKDNCLVDSFPYSMSSEFNQHPLLISTNFIDQNFLESTDSLLRYQHTWLIEKYVPCYILLMTDALAAWSLKKAEDGNPQWSTLTNIRKLAELRKLVKSERRSGAMRVDDSSLIVLSL